MYVDFFTDKKSVIPKGKSKDVNFYLDRIRNGAVKDIVNSIRSALDKATKDELKGKLSAVTFAATFTKRNKQDIKAGSGLVILDFDKLSSYDKVLEFIEKLKSNKYIFACWISPSGKGVKALIKIPTVASNDEYNQFYKSIIDSFEWVNNEYGDGVIDTSGQDISRLCFESYDPDLYVNQESETWIDFKQNELVLETSSLGVVTNIPLQDSDQIANRLMVWFKKHYNGKERNNSFHKLALAFNDFGVDKYIAERYILPNQQKDFNANEIKLLIDSAYKHTANFGSKHFEDNIAKDKLTNLVLAGKKTSVILNEFKNYSQDKIEQEIESIKAIVKIDEFWKLNKYGEIELLPYRFKIFLEHLKYFKYYPVTNTKTFTFITKNENFINTVSEFQMKDKVMNYLIDNNQIRIFDAVAEKSKLFTPQYLSMIDTAEVCIEKDGPDYAMIYYKNYAVKVLKDGITKIDYNDLEGYVWENQVIKRDFIDSDHHESMFRTFIWLISGERVDKYNTLKSVIGYLLHSYKNSANNKAIILNDETISDNPNGGSGKGIITNAIGQMKKLSTIDGKNFDFNKSFAYQTVNTDCQVLAFDDVRKNFEFERLFSLITEGITIEYKNLGAVKLSVKESPKVLISTNYTIKADGGSFLRRIFEIELSSYFGSHRAPYDVFKCMFFEDWDDIEWARFDHFMINCLKYYLENGLVKSEAKNLKIRKFINETSNEFNEFTETLIVNKRYVKAEVFDSFISENDEFKKWLTKRTFNKWIIKYAEYKNYIFSDGNTNGVRWFELKSDNMPAQVLIDEEYHF